MTDTNEPGDVPAPEPAPANIVTHARFTQRPTGRDAHDPEPQPIDLNALRKVGLVTGDLPELDTLGLTEPQYGEETIGTLEGDEVTLYVAYHLAFQAYKAADREVGGDVHIRAGNRLKDAVDGADLSQEELITEDEAVRLYRTHRKAMALREVLFWQINERIGHHDWFLIVRSKGRICRTQRKW